MGKHAAGKRLAQDDDIGSDALMVASQHTARAAKAGLHLVGHQQHVTALAETGGCCQVTRVRHHNAGLALNGLYPERADVRVLQRLFKRRQIIIGDDVETWQKRAEALRRGCLGAG